MGLFVGWIGCGFVAEICFLVLLVRCGDCLLLVICAYMILIVRLIVMCHSISICVCNIIRLSFLADLD